MPPQKTLGNKHKRKLKIYCLYSYVFTTQKRAQPAPNLTNSNIGSYTTVCHALHSLLIKSHAFAYAAQAQARKLLGAYSVNYHLGYD